MSAYRSHSGTTYASRTNTTLTAPSGIQDGDELLLYFLLGAGSVAAIPTPTFPTGFSIIEGPTTVSQDNDILSFSVRSWLLRKRANGESGNYTVTHSSASSDGIIVAVSGGADATHDATANDGDGSGDITFLSITTLAEDAWIGAFCHNWNLWGSGTPPAGTTPTFTERHDSASSLIHFSEGVFAGPGATGNKTKDSDNDDPSNQWAAMLVAIEAAAVGGGEEPPAAPSEGQPFHRRFWGIPGHAGYSIGGHIN